jgi:nitrous oxide reductase accessory protein NosL
MQKGILGRLPARIPEVNGRTGGGGSVPAGAIEEKLSGGGVMKQWTLMAAALFLTVSLAAAAEQAPTNPGEGDRCPTCSMFVGRYKDFRAQVVFKDESYAFFCGVKDMMQYYFDLPKYNPSKKTADVATIVVTDYSNMKLIDGYKAYYVMGSVIFGPMGQEFIPFAEESAARKFMQDNNGKEIVRFTQVNPEVLGELLKKY